MHQCNSVSYTLIHFLLSQNQIAFICCFTFWCVLAAKACRRRKRKLWIPKKCMSYIQKYIKQKALNLNKRSHCFQSWNLDATAAAAMAATTMNRFTLFSDQTLLQFYLKNYFIHHTYKLSKQINNDELTDKRLVWFCCCCCCGCRCGWTKKMENKIMYGYE